MISFWLIALDLQVVKLLLLLSMWLKVQVGSHHRVQEIDQWNHIPKVSILKIIVLTNTWRLSRCHHRTKILCSFNVFFWISIMSTVPHVLSLLNFKAKFLCPTKNVRKKYLITTRPKRINPEDPDCSLRPNQQKLLRFLDVTLKKVTQLISAHRCNWAHVMHIIVEY